MPSIRYINQSAPFWDFIANMEEQGAQHPFFAGPRNNDGPQAWGWGGPHHWHRGPPPHPHHHRDAGEGPSNQAPPSAPAEGAAPGPDADGQTPPTAPAGGAEHDGPFQHRPHPYHRRGGCHGRRGGRGGHGPWGQPNFSGSPLGGLEAFLNSALFGGDNNTNTTAANDSNTQTRASEDFHPDADVFDTETSFQIHISLPGAKKEDIGVNWDAEKSELSVAGVIYRPGDEEFLKTLAMDERKVGAFEKKIRLGTRANAAQVDAEGISAKLEDGVLRVEVPKLEGEFVEVRKVDVE